MGGVVAGDETDFALRIYSVPVDGSEDPTPLFAGPGRQEFPSVSPDGKWLAYISDETGTNEVYVTSFPNMDSGRWQVSTDGGVMTFWTLTVRELQRRRARTALTLGGVIIGVASVVAIPLSVNRHQIEREPARRPAAGLPRPEPGPAEVLVADRHVHQTVVIEIQHAHAVVLSVGGA